jgi:formylglycine-generating enzyme required for sulfatase activity
MLAFLNALENKPEADIVLRLVRLGLEHEMQHQELLVYDIKHLLCDQYDAPMKSAPTSTMKVEGAVEIEGGLFWLGYDSQVQSAKTKDQSPPNYDFAFDNEKPAHQVFLQDYSLDRALVSNGDYLEFIRDKGYQNFRWWFSEGWEVVNREQWRAPL